MKKHDGISIRSCASFREDARTALMGNWKPALLVFLVLMLMTGTIIGANFSYSYSDESLFPRWELEASIGPFSTLSYWRNGNLYKDAATGSSSPFLLPYNPLFVAAAALTALFFLILRPISALAEMRLELNLLDGITPDFSVLRTSARKYWLFVRTELLAYWSAFWPMLLSALIGAAMSMIFPEAEFLAVLFLLAGFVLLFIRLISYAATAYLIVTRPDMTARRAVRMSRQLMKGRKWQFVCLSLSFLGWALVYGLFAAALEGIFSETPLTYIGTLLASLGSIPLTLYLYTAQTSFLRDADIWVNSQMPVSDTVEAPAASGSSADSEPSAEAPAQAEASSEEDHSSIPDDPWADNRK